ncbi:hypothetical protein GOP47_0007071 [Adiantum capillus-veneris]|uniref:Uncharacterized protein n=1 Tax=Adiantum capillus-veneris TaxID=13818 RepID=A0A9D4V1F3_ADICA|nr:hypothetical protein GOP47_0007071 [Adiantum capillus-veneris]
MGNGVKLQVDTETVRQEQWLCRAGGNRHQCGARREILSRNRLLTAELSEQWEPASCCRVDEQWESAPRCRTEQAVGIDTPQLSRERSRPTVGIGSTL